MAQLTAMAGAERPRPTPEQHAAADPESSVWVSASAGTGKTRVLSNRLLRLLLHGADPASILCLTYTKAGAAEMARRVQDDLADFAVMSKERLTATLDGLLGRPPSAQEMQRAEGGLLAVLDLPAGLRIMTIHSFCQSLLRRFPLEAGISPHFELLDPRATAALMQDVRNAVLIDKTPEIRGAIDRLAVALGEHSLAEGLSALNAKREALTRLLVDHGDDVEALVGDVFSTLGVEPGMTVERLRNEVCADLALDEPGLLAAASALATGTKTDVESADRIRPWIEADRHGRLRKFQDYRQAFLTEKNEPRKKLANKAVSEGFPHVPPTLEAEQTRLLEAADREKAIGVAERTAALIRVGAAVIQGYERRKLFEGKLDYADLIDMSRTLLRETQSGDWVRYKLDQRIDHLLIDESQDTSPDQWAIIEALVDDFWSGEGARAAPPTLFVVGDDKQSIFGFQGADVDIFQEKQRSFKALARGAKRSWQDVPLRQSFRSAPAILKAVDAVFADLAIHGGDRAIRHEAFKQDAKGMVEVWPLIEGDAPEETGAWALPDRQVHGNPPELRLARTIALQIQAWIRDGIRLANKDKAIEPKDIMILLPRRGVLQDRLVRELKRNGVPVAGADRIGLTEELAVKDLMALGDALLLPEDDLTCATLLRSPIFGFSDDQLFRLAHDRGDRPLWRRLKDLRDDDPAFAAADDHFRDLLSKVDFTPPYEFFARFLSEGAPNGRRRLLRRLGAAAILPIEAFLAQAITYERSHPPSMQGFLHWLRTDDTALRRDAQEVRDEVRIMTVHGAKGLEAPIVFLADATYQKDMRKDVILWRDDGLPFWKVSKAAQDPYSQTIYAAEEARQLAEHRRLLYVAMTRAEERLIVAGCARRRGRGADDGGKANWYEMIRNGLDRLPETMSFDGSLPSGVSGEIKRFGDVEGDPETAAQATLPFHVGATSGPPLPDWLAACGARRGEGGGASSLG